MIQRFIGLALGALIVVAAGSASAQAFGIEPGVPVSSLRVTEDMGDGFYTVEPPQPNSAFDAYMVVATPENGVCKVQAIGRTQRADRTGSQVRGVFDDLSAALTSRYGTPSKEFDFLHADALWDAPHEFAASLRQNERTLSSYWTRPDTPRLADTISAIGLSAKAINLTDTYVTLTYELSNWPECSTRRAAVNNRGL